MAGKKTSEWRLITLTILGMVAAGAASILTLPVSATVITVATVASAAAAAGTYALSRGLTKAGRARGDETDPPRMPPQ